MMKRKRTHRAALGLLVILGLAASAQKPTGPEANFRAALHKEVAEGDLPGAIRLYEAVASAKDANRSLTARALLNLGGCYEKQGNAEARRAYERLVRDFADQREAAAEAQSRLARIAPVAREVAARKLFSRLRSAPVPTVSRDGRYAAYISWGQSVPRFLDFGSGTQRPLGSGRLVPAGDTSRVAAISPDGALVAYEHEHPNGTADLKLIGLNAAEPTTLVSGLKPFLIADWSHDGSSLLLREMSFRARQGLRWLLVDVRNGNMKTLPLPAPGADEARSFESVWKRLQDARISPDGGFVAYTAPQRGERLTRVIVGSVDGGTQHELGGTADAYVFGWSPDGGKVLFVSDQSGTYDLWAVAVKEGRPHGVPVRLKKDLGAVAAGGVASNGNLYYSVRADLGELFIGDLDLEAGSVRNVRQVDQPRGFLVENARWGPDGSRLLIERRSVAGPQAVIYDVAKGKESLVKPAESGAWAFARWSADGKAVIITRRDPWRAQWLDTATGKVTMEVRAPDANAFYTGLNPSPDGRHIFVAKGGASSNASRIFRIATDTGEEREVYPVRPRMHAISPDGSHVACAGFGDSIKIYPAKGGEGRELVKDPRSGLMAWTPDGKYLIYGSAGDGDSKPGYWIVPVAGGQPRGLEVPLDGAGYISIHPDGRKIAITVSDQVTELWVLENLRIGEK